MRANLHLKVKGAYLLGLGLQIRVEFFYLFLIVPPEGYSSWLGRFSTLNSTYCFDFEIFEAQADIWKCYYDCSLVPQVQRAPSRYTFRFNSI